MRTRIKICCVAGPDEAAIAARAGADMLGLVSAMPSGPGVISEATIAEVAAGVPPGVTAVLLTAAVAPEEIAEQQRRCRVPAVQLVDEDAAAGLPRLRELIPGVRWIQVVHAAGPGAIDTALAAAPYADAVLLDSGNPSASVPELGGTGRVHDWTVSAEIVRRCGKPVFLAGGLHAGNVAEAVARVRPFGVDVCTKVRTEGKLDPVKLHAFVAALASSPAP